MNGTSHFQVGLEEFEPSSKNYTFLAIAIIITGFIIGGAIFYTHKQTTSPEITSPETPKILTNMQFTAPVFSEPLKGKSQVSSTDEKKLSDMMVNMLNQSRTEERTTSRPPYLKEETWLNMSKFVNRVGMIFCPKDLVGNGERGSGFLINKEGNVLTNYHVVDGMIGNRCFVAFASDYRQPPDKIYTAYLTNRYDKDIDFIWLYIDEQVYPEGGKILTREFNYIPVCDSNIIQLGDPIEVFGYPVYGGDTITGTDGIISGSLSIYFKMNAKIDGGNSGGPVMIDDPQYECYIGMATLSYRAEEKITPKSIEQLFYAIKSRYISGYNW
jgi:S1-C subfamily serine protease